MLLKVKVHPGSREERVKKTKENEFEVYLREEAKEGEANKRLVTIFQNLFPRKRVFILKGGKKMNKILEIK